MHNKTFETKQQLVEAIEQINDSNINASDLALVVEAAGSAQWSNPMTAEEFFSYLDKLDADESV